MTPSQTDQANPDFENENNPSAHIRGKFTFFNIQKDEIESGKKIQRRESTSYYKKKPSQEATTHLFRPYANTSLKEEEYISMKTKRI